MKRNLSILLLVCILWMPGCGPRADAATSVQETPVAVIQSVTDAAEDPAAVAGEPCEALGQKYEHDGALGEIKAEYIGSWHAAPSVGSGYAERVVFFASGNYLFFPSQYECAVDDEACIASPVEEGIWGVQEGEMSLAKDGELRDPGRISIGNVVDSSPDESPYPMKTTLDGVTYWLMSSETNLWDPLTGELCP